MKGAIPLKTKTDGPPMLRVDNLDKDSAKHPILRSVIEHLQERLGKSTRLVQGAEDFRLGQCGESLPLAIQAATTNFLNLAKGTTAVALLVPALTEILPQLGHICIDCELHSRLQSMKACVLCLSAFSAVEVGSALRVNDAAEERASRHGRHGRRGRGKPW